MRILAIEREPSTLIHANLPDLLRAEAAGIWELQKRGIVRDIWFTTDRHAIVMLECPNAGEARKHLAALPLVRAGLIEFTLHELHSYDGFERLFATGGEPATLSKHEEPAEY